ncbi:hypothetical protein NXF25_018981 [Crotalus adamanteus]|uniref:Uncharacterized protein n=1 Tax=Crotalus adamanteus TaxID=8729 RepID=A0AAW1B1C8_CROAD
MGHWATSQLGH